MNLTLFPAIELTQHTGYIPVLTLSSLMIMIDDRIYIITVLSTLYPNLLIIDLLMFTITVCFSRDAALVLVEVLLLLLEVYTLMLHSELVIQSVLWTTFFSRSCFLYSFLLTVNLYEIFSWVFLVKGMG